MQKKPSEKPSSKEAFNYWNKSLAMRGRAHAKPEDPTVFSPSFQEALKNKITDGLRAQGLNDRALRALMFEWNNKVSEGVRISLSGTVLEAQMADQYFDTKLASKNGFADSFRNELPACRLKGYAEVTLKANTMKEMARALGIDFRIAPGGIPGRK